MTNFVSLDSSSFIRTIEKLLLEEIAPLKINGADSDDNEYCDLVSLWEKELQPVKNKSRDNNNNNK